MPLPLDCSSCSCGGWYPPSIAIIRYTYYLRRKEIRRQPSTGGKQDGEEERKKSYVNTWSEGYKSPPPIGKKRKNTTTHLQEYTRRIFASMAVVAVALKNGVGEQRNTQQINSFFAILSIIRFISLPTTHTRWTKEDLLRADESYTTRRRRRWCSCKWSQLY